MPCTKTNPIAAPDSNEQQARDAQRASDECFMREALAEAAKGEGRTRPNPPVGAVIVKDGEIIARGHHEFAGGPHAEINALNALNEQNALAAQNAPSPSPALPAPPSLCVSAPLRLCVKKTLPSTSTSAPVSSPLSLSASPSAAGATIYITLEPCSTTGRTGPCTSAIIAAGITRAVIACEDANPAHRGAGLRILRDAGIETTTGVCEPEAREQLAPFFKHISSGLPFLTLKMAQTLDGAIADHCGASKWITSKESRAHVHETLRAKADCVLVGSGTVLADDPTLLRADGTGFRAVLDSRATIPLDAKIYADGHATQTILFTTDAAARAAPEKLAAIRASGAAIEMWQSTDTAPRTQPIPLDFVLRRLGARGMLRVLCEGGAALASSIINADLADELLLFIAPTILGAGSKRVFGAFPFDLPTAPRFEIASTSKIGADLLLRCLPQRHQTNS